MVSSKSELNEYIHVASPGSWLLLTAVFLLLLGVAVWGVFGRLDTKARAAVVVGEGAVRACVLDDEIPKIGQGKEDQPSGEGARRRRSRRRADGRGGERRRQPVSFEYDHNGLRVQKVVETDWYPKTITYTLHGKLITHMTIYYTDFETEQPRQTNLHFFYDAQCRPAFVEYNGVKYTYVHNLQGDIIELLDEMGVSVVRYEYDAWGKPLNCTGTMALTLGVDNPFRYRGYVYDEETGLYYLRSRYYNPCWGRFVNADDVTWDFVSRRINNCFEYCFSCPIMYCDADGNSGTNFELQKGWYFRIDNFPTRHIHVWRDGGDEFAQNADGTVHEKLYGNPPKWVRQKLKDLNKWNWSNNDKTPAPTPSLTPSPSSTPRPEPGRTPAPLPNPAPKTSRSRKQKFTFSGGGVAKGVLGVLTGLLYFGAYILSGGTYYPHVTFY